MPGNPYGNLAGISDPSVPGWQRRAFERVKARNRGSKRSTQRQDGVRAFFDTPFRVLLDEAAKRRGMTMAGYCRRALAAFIEHDLGLRTGEAAQHMAVPTPYKEVAGAGYHKKTRDNLVGYGPWVITGLEEAPNGDEGEQL